ncbi:MAG: hypothetical protein IPF99_43070 [Deltaproteobacteria bacterium]|nr:hypothetical protein [Deltaproteobacteria bacterium]
MLETLHSSDEDRDLTVWPRAPLWLRLGSAPVPRPQRVSAPPVRVVEAAPEPAATAFTASAEDTAAWVHARTLLDFNARAHFGGGRLAGGFSPDPWTFPLTAGGGRNPINVADLGIRDGLTGERCGRAFVTRRPDFHFDLAEGAALPLLRFYVLAENSSDATLMINEPGGRWRCNDDHHRETWGNRLTPAIDFAHPPPGRYDIWVGTFDASTRNAATLHITGHETNHP